MYKQNEKLNCLDLVPYRTPLGGNEFRRENSLMSEKLSNDSNAADLFISRQGYMYKWFTCQRNVILQCLRIVIFVLFIGDYNQRPHTSFDFGRKMRIFWMTQLRTGHNIVRATTYTSTTLNHLEAMCWVTLIPNTSHLWSDRMTLRHCQCYDVIVHIIHEMQNKLICAFLGLEMWIAGQFALRIPIKVITRI